MWKSVSAKLRRELASLIAQYGFPNTMAQPSRLQAFLKACVTSGSLTDLSEEAMGAMVDATSKALIKEFRGDYFKNKAVVTP